MVSDLWQNVALAVIKDDEGRVLLVKRIEEEYAGYWGLPGGKIRLEEDANEAILREIEEETGLASENLTTPIWCGMVRETYEKEAGTRLGWCLYVYSLSLKYNIDDNTPEEFETEWFHKKEIESNQFVIPSVVEIIRAAISLEEKSLSFFEMQDEVVMESGALTIKDQKVEFFQKVPKNL